jgi:hypothetical protein
LIEKSNDVAEEEAAGIGAFGESVRCRSAPMVTLVDMMVKSEAERIIASSATEIHPGSRNFSNVSRKTSLRL